MEVRSPCRGRETILGEKHCLRGNIRGQIRKGTGYNHRKVIRKDVKPRIIKGTSIGAFKMRRLLKKGGKETMKNSTRG